MALNSPRSVRNTVVFTTLSKPKPAAKNGCQILQHLASLLGNRLAYKSAGGGIQRNLPGAEQQRPGVHSLGIRTDGLRGVRR